MTLVLLEGFDHLDTVNDTTSINEKLNTTNTSLDLDSTTPANRGNSVLFNATGDTIRLEPSQAQGVLSGIVAFHFRTNGITISLNEAFATLVDSGFTTHQIQLRVREGLLYLYKGNGTTSLVRSAGHQRFINDTWYHIEWKFHIANSSFANANVVKVDGVEWINLAAGIDTSNGGNNNFGRCALVGTNGARYFDDVYFNTLTGTNNFDFLGPSYVQTLFPTGDASVAFVGQDGDSIDNYQNVDETSPDGDTTFNTTSASNARDRYLFGDLDGSVSSIFGVDIISRAKKNEASPNVTWRNFAHVSGNTYDKATSQLTTSYDFYNNIFETNPEIGGQWTANDINLSQWGVQYDGV